MAEKGKINGRMKGGKTDFANDRLFKKLNTGLSTDYIITSDVNEQISG